MKIYKLVYQYSHNNPNPNTPNSSLTNTKNRENLTLYSKLENSRKYAPANFFISTLFNCHNTLLIQDIKSAKIQVIRAPELFTCKIQIQVKTKSISSRTLNIKYIYFATIPNQSIYIEHASSKHQFQVELGYLRLVGNSMGNYPKRRGAQ